MTVEQDRFKRGHKIPGGKGFYDVSLSAGEESIAHDVPGGVLRKEEYAGFRRHRQYPSGYLDSAHVGKTDIEYHDFRHKLRHLLDGGDAILGFTHDLNFRFHCKGKIDEMPPGRVIVHYKNFNVVYQNIVS